MSERLRHLMVPPRMAVIAEPPDAQWLGIISMGGCDLPIGRPAFLARCWADQLTASHSFSNEVCRPAAHPGSIRVRRCPATVQFHVAGGVLSLPLPIEFSAALRIFGLPVARPCRVVAGMGRAPGCSPCGRARLTETLVPVGARTVAIELVKRLRLMADGTTLRLRVHREPPLSVSRLGMFPHRRGISSLTLLKVCKNAF
jgi:hypothetical protein